MTNATADFMPWMGVFETLRVMNGAPLFMAEHEAELRRSMAALELKSEFNFAKAHPRLPALTGRWRWIVTAEGARTLFSEESPAVEAATALSISPIRVGSANWDARFKTVSYLSHIQAWKTAATAEVVLLNEWGHVASASRGNIFWRRGDRLFTPDHEAGCRCGVVRGFVLKQNQVEMGHFASTELLEADEIFVTNSMKGIVSVNEIGRRVLTEFPQADELRRKYAAAIASQLER